MNNGEGREGPSFGLAKFPQNGEVLRLFWCQKICHKFLGERIKEEIVWLEGIFVGDFFLAFYCESLGEGSLLPQRKLLCSPIFGIKMM